MRDSRPIATGATVVILGAAAAMYVERSAGLAPSINKQPHEAVGTVLAKQALGLLKPGGQLTPIVQDTSAFPNPDSDIQLARFKKAIRHAHVSIGSVVALEIDPLRPMEVPAGDFYQLIKKTPKGSGIVSFLGPPLLSFEQSQRLGEIQPGTVAFRSGSVPSRVNLKAFFEQGLLHAAVISQPTPKRDKARVAGFDRFFETITMSNLSDLATTNAIP